ncbi:NACHT domain-containing protein [Flavobacterium sp.]|uniref:NACHT domain-containing protein n=1 Tax=Flavobacterium sp. TaxID=239 RepID=UPI003A908BB7
MAKKTLESVSSILPDFIGNIFSYLKNNFDENGKDLIDSSNGTIGIVIKLISKPLIDNYFKKVTSKKLENYGVQTYFKASLIQAQWALGYVENNLPKENDPKSILRFILQSTDNEIKDLKKDEIILVFQSIYHPCVIFVKKIFENLLLKLGADDSTIKEFIYHFNNDIEAKIKSEFGEDYEKHIQNISKYLKKENETEFLIDTIKQSKIGFKTDENLKYVTTYAQWLKVSSLKEKKNEYTEDDIEEIREIEENTIKPVENLIEEYFKIDPKNHLDKILFLVADFGKGKSVFMRQYAAKLAKIYLLSGEGYFPIYFNLRDFKNYSTEPNLGIISDYLETKYGIKINDEYFQNKKYVFLIDSLDESGELNKRAIDKVIQSVKNIQGIDKTKYRTNRIIISTRPFDEGLHQHLNDHKPYIIKNDEGRDIAYYVSIYGFKKKQFNEWLIDTLSKKIDLIETTKNNFAKKIFTSIGTNEYVDIYNELLENKTLSISELKRPIFAYMIYQLIINNVDFLSVGKLGVYLSFLNLLTKEAKHIHDENYKVNLKEEFEFRNVLHATSSLWMFERQKGKQGSLKKSDICRVLEGKDTGLNDSEILEKFKNDGFTEIQFLSHSYFGENDNVLHFQHQSFAEILLAEYYLKVFIKYALDEDTDFEEARAKLTLGEPTEQTIIFLVELLKLFREASDSNTDNQTIEKRRLLFPLMASLSTQKYNKLLCNDLKYSWFNNYNINENETQYPNELLSNWCIDDNKLNKIIDLAANILASKHTYVPTTATSRDSLFNKEVLEIKNKKLGTFPLNIDKWLALLVGNTLYNDYSNNNYFNWDKNIPFNELFDLIRTWNFTSNDSAPIWGKELFLGINMTNNKIDIELIHYNFSGINFSYSYFKNIRCWNTNFSGCKLDNLSFINNNIVTSLFMDTSIQNIQEIKNLYMHYCITGATELRLLEAFHTTNLYQTDILEKNKSLISPIDISEDFNVFKTISGFMVYGLKNSFFTIKKIKEFFHFENENVKKEFFKLIDSLKEFETKKRINKSK